MMGALILTRRVRGCRGTSLNDALMTGPIVQQDLVSILMQFYTYIYVFIADIIKIHRQILIDESQTHLQRILWRGDSNSPINTYELLTERVQHHFLRLDVSSI